MTRLKTKLSLAAIAILAGAAVTTAIVEQYTDVDEWVEDTRRHRDTQSWRTFYIAVQDGTTIPKAYAVPEGEAYVLGDCAAKQCCLADFCYDYQASALIGGWRLYEVFAPTYIVRGWKEWADGTAGGKFFWGHKQVVDTCKTYFTGAQCIELLRGDTRCWRLSTGGCCRYGSRGCEPTVSGLNGEACPYGLVVASLPCSTNRGAGSAMGDSKTTWTVDAAGDLVEVTE